MYDIKQILYTKVETICSNNNLYMNHCRWKNDKIHQKTGNIVIQLFY